MQIVVLTGMAQGYNVIFPDNAIRKGATAVAMKRTNFRSEFLTEKRRSKQSTQAKL